MSKYPGQTQSRSGLWSIVSPHEPLTEGFLEAVAHLHSSRYAVDDAVLTGTGGDANTSFVGLNNSALDEDVSSDIVGIGGVFNHVVNGAERRLSRFLGC